jgi:xylulokinase
MAQTNEPVILSIDQGTSGLKAALITIQGRVLGWQSEPIQLFLTADGGVEQSPEEWWQAFIICTRRLLAEGVVTPSSVIAVCCSTQGEGTIPVDREGKALMNCVLWMDMRGKPDLINQFKGLVNISGMSALKVLNWIKLTGGMPSASGKDPAAHMLFIRNHYPDVYARTYKFLNVLDYLNLRLTGVFAATYDSILTSWVTDNRDPDKIHYDPGLVRSSGVDGDKFPEIVPCTAILGTLKDKVAEELGLPPTVKVVAGAIDNTAAAIGAGAVEDYLPHLYIGTSSWITAHVPFKKTDIGSSMASLPCALPGRYMLTALQATAGGNLNFLRDKIIYNKDELLQEAEVPDIFKYLDQIAARVPPGANGVIYTPWIWGERAPVEDNNLRAGLYNLSLNNSREDIIRAFLEGIALNTRWLLQPVKKFLKRDVDKIHIVGGGAQSDIWCQIFADVMGVCIKQVEDPVYANARGAAWIGAVGLKEIHFVDITVMVKFKQTYLPIEKNRSLYDQRYEQFLMIYNQMKNVYHRMNR